MDEFSRKYLNDIEIEISRAESAAYQSLVDLYKTQAEIRQAAILQASAIERFKNAIGKMKSFARLPGLTEHARTRLASASEYSDDAAVMLAKLWREESDALLKSVQEILAGNVDEQSSHPKP